MQSVLRGCLKRKVLINQRVAPSATLGGIEGTKENDRKDESMGGGTYVLGIQLHLPPRDITRLQNTQARGRQINTNNSSTSRSFMRFK